MKTIKVKDILPDFEKLANNFSNTRIKSKMLDVCDEDMHYVADELLLLSEEILSQISAYGVCLYLVKGGNIQSEQNNDYILHKLFLFDGHQNAGPVFNETCKIIKGIQSNLSSEEFEIFDSNSSINIELKKLAAFRNALMHGFFVLPADKNKELIIKIKALLEKKLILNAITNKFNYHFWNDEGFTGHWRINEQKKEWDKLALNKYTLFDKLASRSKEELHSYAFVNAVRLKAEIELDDEYKNKLTDFIFSETPPDSETPPYFKESLFVSFHSKDWEKQDEFYECAFNFLNERSDLKIISYSIDSEGIGFTSYLMFHQLLKGLGLQTDVNEPKKKIISEVKKLKNNEKKELLILINNIHLVPFASDHITSQMKFFKESKIHFIGIGQEYEHLNSIFSQKVDLREKQNEIPNETEIDQLIKNHTRHRGPFENENDYTNLKNIIRLICEILQSNQPVIARQLADEQKTDIEMINEALYVLYPYFKYEQIGEDNKYKKDELDELYGFPKTQTETSSIFLTLGRRDIELEYKHKILKP
jgi:hypothetical protein